MPALKAFAALAIALPLLAGCSQSTAPVANPNVREIDDVAYVHGRYYFLQYPAAALASGATIDFSTLQVFVDDRNGANDQGSRAGYASIDGTMSPALTPTLTGAFDGLRPLADYEVTTFPWGDRFPVLVLKQALPASSVLAVAYEEILPGGGRRAVGEVTPCQGVPCDTLRLQLVQVSNDRLPAKAGAPDEYETDPALAPFAVTRDLALKNVYDLGARNIDPAAYKLEVRTFRGPDSEKTSVYLEGTESFGYLRILGVDVFRDAGGGSPVVGADGVPDAFTNATFLDLERGILMFPDLRPFDPRLPGRPDARPEELEFFRTRVANADPSVPGLRGRVLWPADVPSPPGSAYASTPPGLAANPRVYDRRLVSSADRRYFIRFESPVFSIAP